MKQKRLLSLLLAVCLVLCLAPFGTSAEETVTSGTCGDNLTWNFDEVTGKLIISGEGEMNDYDSSTITAPWHDFREKILYVDIAEGVASIGDGAFAGCALREIAVPDSVTSIGSNAFNLCEMLQKVTLPEGITRIESSTFQGCWLLNDITLPDSITSIGQFAFYDCEMLGYLFLPEKLTSIEMSAFRGCTRLFRIDFPVSVASIESAAFDGCSNLSSIYFYGDAPEIDAYDVFKDVTATVYYPIGNATWTNDIMQDYGGTLRWVEYDPRSCGDNLTWELDENGKLTISGTGEMWDYSPPYVCPGWYNYEDNLNELVVEEGVTSIGAFAFYGCSSLTKISLPASLAHIGDHAFMDCSSLTEIDLPESLTSIGNNAFVDCSSLTEIDLPESLTSIGGDVFYRCRSLAKITIPSGVTCIGAGAFGYCSSLTEIDLPESLTSIESNLFRGCSSLTEIEIPASVTELGCSIFDLCENLNAIKFIGNAPEFFEESYTQYEGITIVSSGTFSGLTALIYFPADNETWTEEVLSGNYGGTLTWVPYRDYEILDGAESTWDPDSGESLTVRADGALADFAAVKVDGIEVPAECYTVTEGSTIVTLSADYLETLSEGTHTLTVVFTYGEAETAFTILPSTKPTPTEPDPTEPTPTEPVEDDIAQTADSDIIYLFITLVAITGIGLAAIAVIERKRFRF